MRKNIFKKLALLSTFVMTSMFVSGYTPVEGTGNPDDWDIDDTQFVYDYGMYLAVMRSLSYKSFVKAQEKSLVWT